MAKSIKLGDDTYISSDGVTVGSTSETLTNKLGTLETSSHASSTYATKSELGNYETSNHASNTYATKSSVEWTYSGGGRTVTIPTSYTEAHIFAVCTRTGETRETFEFLYHPFSTARTYLRQGYGWSNLNNLCTVEVSNNGNTFTLLNFIIESANVLSNSILAVYYR